MSSLAPCSPDFYPLCSQLPVFFAPPPHFSWLAGIPCGCSKMLRSPAIKNFKFQSFDDKNSLFSEGAVDDNVAVPPPPPAPPPPAAAAGRQGAPQEGDRDSSTGHTRTALPRYWVCQIFPTISLFLLMVASLKGTKKSWKIRKPENHNKSAENWKNILVET